MESRRPASRLRSRSNVLAVVLADVGYDDEKLCELAGFPLSTLRHQRSMGWPSRRTQARVEFALGTAIWSEPAEFSKRLRQQQLLGVDPVFITRPQLRALAKEAALPLWSDMPNKRQFIDRLCDHLAGHPHLRRNISTSNLKPYHD